jgi:uncharacterized membrane protein HdeD (DUF308 family)
MSEQQPVEAKHPERRAALWITLARSVLALALGLALILQPDKSRPILINFIGMFWLAAGIMSLRWGTSGERAQRVSVIVGIVGIVAGVLVLGRFILAQFVGEAPMVLLIGVVAVLTGLVHVFEGFRTGSNRQRQRSWISMLLGVFEIVLGLVVLVWRGLLRSGGDLGFPRRVRVAARSIAPASPRSSEITHSNGINPYSAGY